MTTLETLVAARKRIRYARSWTQNVHAKDRSGERVPYGDPNAVCWCMQGAIGAEIGTDAGAFTGAFNALAAVLPPVAEQYNPVVLFNDSPYRKHAEVLAAFDEAIAKLVTHA